MVASLLCFGAIRFCGCCFLACAGCAGWGVFLLPRFWVFWCGRFSWRAGLHERANKAPYNRYPPPPTTIPMRRGIYRASADVQLIIILSKKCKIKTICMDHNTWKLGIGVLMLIRRRNNHEHHHRRLLRRQ
jgi:hypothetical protein